MYHSDPGICIVACSVLKHTHCQSHSSVCLDRRQIGHHNLASHLADVYEAHTALGKSSPFSQQGIFGVSNDWQTGN